MPKKLPHDQLAARKRSPIAQYLLGAFLDWQKAAGETRSQIQFAAFLGLKRSTLTKLLSGHVDMPESDTVDLIAAKLGPGIYDALGLPRPDPLLRVVMDNWGALSSGQRETISEWLGISEVGLLASAGDNALAKPSRAQAARAGASRGDGRARPKHK